MVTGDVFVDDNVAADPLAASCSLARNAASGDNGKFVPREQFLNILGGKRSASKPFHDLSLLSRPAGSPTGKPSVASKRSRQLITPKSGRNGGSGTVYLLCGILRARFKPAKYHWHSCERQPTIT